MMLVELYRYLQLYRLLQKRDAEMADAFNDMRRSRAIERLAAMILLGVVTDDEIARFSPATRDAATYLASIRHAGCRGPPIDCLDVPRGMISFGVLLYELFTARKPFDGPSTTDIMVAILDGYHLWSGRYDPQMEDGFDVQDEIAGAIVRALEDRRVRAGAATIPALQAQPGRAR